MQIRSEVDNVSWKETCIVMTPASEIQVKSLENRQTCQELTSVRGQRMDIDTRILPLLRMYLHVGGTSR